MTIFEIFFDDVKLVYLLQILLILHLGDIIGDLLDLGLKPFYLRGLTDGKVQRSFDIRVCKGGL